jgi:hypothetical protein
MGVASYLQQVVLVSESNSTQEKGKKTSKSQPKLQYNGRGVVNQIKKDFSTLFSISDYTPIHFV